MFKILEEENMIDVRRQFNTSSREYTFFSNRHKSYSRIDIIFLSQQMVTYTKRIEILPQTISDHNPVMW